MILGCINGKLKNKSLDNYPFERVCRYSECYKEGPKRNDYNKMDAKLFGNDKGLYSFVDDNGEILYIGVAYDRDLKERVVQHFRRKDTGGLLFKLDGNDSYIEMLKNSTLYIYKYLQNNNKNLKRELLFIEAYLIGLYKPKLNFR